MKLLMITRKLDSLDGQTGFVFNWVRKLSQKVDQLKIICLEKGDIKGLPENVEIVSLGKERGKNRIREFINFQRGVLKFINKVDGVFCHQNPEYTILVAPYAKLFRKKIVCFYGHKAVNWRVRLMHFFAHKVITSSEEGFRMDSPKRKVVGQGIDAGQFVPNSEKTKLKKDWIEIISVGRISKIKNYETLIKAAEILKKKTLSFKINIVHRTPKGKKQIGYFNELNKMIEERDLNDYVKFIGEVPNIALIRNYWLSDFSVNLCPTGAPDKAVLETMACGIPTLVANETFRKDFGSYADQLIFKYGNARDLADKLDYLMCGDQLEEMGQYLRKQVVENHNLDNLLTEIIKCF